MNEGGDPAGPAGVVHRWIAAWSALDAAAVTRLFAPEASYVSGRDGELDRLPRRFALAARTWAAVEIDDVSIDEPLTADGLSVVAGRYRFSGVDRRGRRVAYSGALTFVLRRDGEVGDGAWRIVRFHESVLPSR